MKSFLVVLSIAACAFAHRLRIIEPTPLQDVKAGDFFTMEFQQELSSGALKQVSIVVAATPCFNNCDQPDKLGSSTVMYNGIFTPKSNSSNPAQGRVQAFRFQMPKFQPGQALVSVGHRFDVGGATFSPAFDYTSVRVNVQ